MTPREQMIDALACAAILITGLLAYGFLV